MELITVSKSNINGAEINSVNARELHFSLEVKTRFADWIKRAIDKYDFIENVDFTVLKFVNGKATQIDYIVTLDMAKELCMLDDSNKGKLFRKYFIQCEKQANKPLTISDQIQLLAIGSTELNQRITILEQTKRLEAWQERALIDAKNKKVYSFNPDGSESTSKLHRAVWAHFKKRFNLPRYNELPAVKFDEGVSFINGITLIDLVG